MSVKQCAECGAELRLRPARCPLCGADTSAQAPRLVATDVETYHDGIRRLRKQLRELREGAEAV